MVHLWHTCQGYAFTGAAGAGNLLGWGSGLSPGRCLICSGEQRTKLIARHVFLHKYAD